MKKEERFTKCGRCKKHGPCYAISDVVEVVHWRCRRCWKMETFGDHYSTASMLVKAFVNPFESIEKETKMNDEMAKQDVLQTLRDLIYTQGTLTYKEAYEDLIRACEKEKVEVDEALQLKYDLLESSINKDRKALGTLYDDLMTRNADLVHVNEVLTNKLAAYCGVTNG